MCVNAHIQTYIYYNTRPSLYRSLTFRSQRSSIVWYLFLFPFLSFSTSSDFFARFFASLPSFFSFFRASLYICILLLSLPHCITNTVVTILIFHPAPFLYFSLSLSRSPFPVSFQPRSYPLLHLRDFLSPTFPQPSFASHDFSQIFIIN